jgi:hypothetical protein
MKTGFFYIVFTLLLAFFDKNINFDNATSKVMVDTGFTISGLYDSLSEPSLSIEALSMAYKGYNAILKEDLLYNDSLLTLIDYSQPSNNKRLYIIDIKNKCVVLKTLVAHGVKSGDTLPNKFSNLVQSHQSSLGFYITENSYLGKHGYSLRINGIEESINDNALQRAIVFHGAHYVSPQFLVENGRLGRSFGCPALPLNENKMIIDLIKNRSCVFIYYPSKEYISKSAYFSKAHYLQTIGE